MALGVRSNRSFQCFRRTSQKALKKKNNVVDLQGSENFFQTCEPPNKILKCPSEKRNTLRKKHLSLTFSPRNRQEFSSTPRRVGCEFVVLGGFKSIVESPLQRDWQIGTQECWRKMIQWSRCSLRIFFWLCSQIPVNSCGQNNWINIS